MHHDAAAVEPELDLILLIEDNPNDQELTQRALKKAGAAKSVVVAHDGAEAIDYLFGLGSFTGRDLQSMPQLVFLDLKLPRIDGLGVLERMRESLRTRNIPVIILTSSDEDRDLNESYQSGADCYVQKTVDFDLFCRTIEKLLPQWVDLVRKRTGLPNRKAHA